MSTDNVAVNTATGVGGNTYTTSVSNDKLTTQDFLKLMIAELKLQDPTSPMDSQRMLDTQMKMSSVNTNLQMIETMEALSNSFTQSNLSNAANVIGKNIEDGNIGENGVNKAYTVRSVESNEGEVSVIAQQMLYVEDQVKDNNGNIINYNVNGEILNESGETTGQKVALKNPGEVILENGKPVILDENNEKVVGHEYEMAGGVLPVYSDQLTTIPFSSITRIF